MVNWIRAWWQVRQPWSFLRHTYRCGWNLYPYGDTAHTSSRQRYAMAYAEVRTTPQVRSTRTRY
jgi:hypothetical protein